MKTWMLLAMMLLLALPLACGPDEDRDGENDCIEAYNDCIFRLCGTTIEDQNCVRMTKEAGTCDEYLVGGCGPG